MKKETPDIKLLSDLKTQYIVDNLGQKTAVVMDFAAFEQFLEKIEELYLGALAEHALATEAEYRDFEDVKKTLLKNR